MIYELLIKAIEQHNEFMTIDMLKLQVEFFYTAGKLAEVEYNELNGMLNPVL